MEEKKTQRFSNGEITSTIWQCDDIKMGHAHSKFTELISRPASSQQEVVRLHVGLKGDYLFSYKQLNRSFDLVGGHHNMMYSPDFDMVVQNKTLELETFGVQFPKDRFIQFTQEASEPLKRFSDRILNGKSSLLSEQWGAVDTSIQTLIQQILHCNYSGDLKKQFLLSKSIELLVLSAGSCENAAQKSELFLKTRRDREKIIAVRDLINSKAHCPPNLSEIAKAVGLNEYKLKRGFKETFHTTVFGYLTEQRLHLARRYLRDTQKTAAEISVDLGYATPQHFNNAFKKKFGATPNQDRNNP